MITVISKLFFFLSQTQMHKFQLNSWILFSIASALFQEFFPNQTHIVKISFWFLET